MKRVLLLFVLQCLVVAGIYAQGKTTGEIAGLISDAENQPLIGATVVATHTPTGTVFGGITDVNGNFKLNNVRVGGPYEMVVSYVGFDPQKFTNIFVSLNETRKVNITLQEAGTLLESIEIVGRASTLGNSAGTSTSVNADQIESLPTLDRNLNDFLRLTPQSSGFGDGISFAGVNNRFNAVYIDGAVNNDVFGLSSSGTNGGQTGIAPFSIDIIDQLQVVLSPYDVTLGGFAGGGINAVTKSGTNEIKGSAYYFLRNESIAGRTNGQLAERLFGELDPDTNMLTYEDSLRTPLADFSQQTYGFTLGGPIIKNKVFFFVNAEIQDDVVPTPFEPELYTENGEGRASLEDLENLRGTLMERYGYDPGTFGDVSDDLQGLKLFGKLDFNLNKDNRLTLRHQYTRAEQFSRNAGNSNTINFSNNGVYFPSVTNSSALELNTTLGNTMSNNLIVGYTSVVDDRGSLGNDFPSVTIDDGNRGLIRFGTDAFSTGNFLSQRILSVTDNFKIYKGRNAFTIGTHNEFYNINNVFIRQNFGQYRYASLDDFLNDAGATEYDRSYSLVDEITGDNTAAAARFNAGQFGIYAQDEITVTKNFSITAGLRLDIPLIFGNPEVDTFFNNTALPLMQDQYEIASQVEAGQAPDAQLMFSPRLGFEYNQDLFTLRGGLGIFTSRIPFVWPGAMFNNNGLTVGNVNEQNIEGPIAFRPDVNEQYTNPDFSVPSGDMNLFVDDFKYPQVFRTNLGIDFKLPAGIDLTLEGVYTKTLNNVLYTNINDDQTGVTQWNGADTRNRYTRDQIVGQYQAVYVGHNTNRGYTYNLSTTVAKKFDDVFDVFLAYNYGDAFGINDGTSSQNSSQWRGQIGIDGRNSPVFGRSDYSQGHRVIASTGAHIYYTKDKGIATHINLFYNGQSGSAFSYVVGGGDARNLNNESGSTSRNRSLIYVPANQSEMNFLEYEDGDGNIVSADDQWTRFNEFIESDESLESRRGQYAEKNGGRSPWTNSIDIAIRQDLGGVLGGKLNRLQLTFDLFNLGNLLNKNWGVNYFVPGDFNNYTILEYEGLNDAGEPTYTYQDEVTGVDAFNIAQVSSRWRARIGVRYLFN